MQNYRKCVKNMNFLRLHNEHNFQTKQIEFFWLLFHKQSIKFVTLTFVLPKLFIKVTLTNKFYFSYLSILPHNWLCRGAPIKRAISMSHSLIFGFFRIFFSLSFQWRLQLPIRITKINWLLRRHFWCFFLGINWNSFEDHKAMKQRKTSYQYLSTSRFQWLVQCGMDVNLACLSSWTSKFPK